MYYAPIVKDKDNTFSQELKNGLDAEMLFIRSLCYFYLVRLWKDVPLVLNPSVSDTVNIYLAKSTENVVLNQVIKDLKKASALAYTTQFYDEPEFYKGRANKYSIQALLADVLLWTERYNEAIIYCDSIINTGKFDLESTGNWFYLYYPGNSITESLFEIQFDDNYESQENPMYSNVLSSIQISSKLQAIMDETDIRTCGNRGPTQKYRGISIQTSRNTNQRDANFIYYRYADVLLIKAEALAETNDMVNANYLVREVAERAGQTYTTVLTYDGFMSTLMNERAKEFAVEGKRWFDILRWGKKRKFENKKLIIDLILDKTTNPQARAILEAKLSDTLGYYLPIYDEEIQYNKQLKQNSFYDK